MSRWICLSCLLLLLPAAGFSQPQPPITWGPTELLMDLPLDQGVADIDARGDTIVLTAYTPYITGPTTHIIVKISGDDGQTWSDWHALPGPDDQWLGSGTAFTRRGIHVCYEPQAGQNGFATTTNLGQTWSGPPTLRPITWPLDQVGDTVFCRESIHQVIWTGDGGRTFSPERDTGFHGDVDLGFSGLAIGGGQVHCVAVTIDNPELPHLYYTRAPLWQGDFEPLHRLAEDIWGPTDAAIDMDDAGNGVIMVSARLRSQSFRNFAELAYYTHDGGTTWSINADTLTHNESGNLLAGSVIHDDSNWLMTWADTVHAEGNSYGGWWCKFSANHGRNWYSRQQITGDSLWSGNVDRLEIRGNRVRMYAYYQTFRSADGHLNQCFLRWEGEMHPDSIPPVLAPVSLPAETVRVEDPVLFTVTAQDNDTLSGVTLLLNWGDGGVQSCPMTRGNNNTFSYSFQLPEEAQYFYRIEAEDFWENTGSYPDSGWASFHTAHWSAVSAFILPPSSLSNYARKNPYHPPRPRHT